MLSQYQRKWLLLDQENAAMVVLHRPRLTTRFADFLLDSWPMVRQLVNKVILYVGDPHLSAESLEQVLDKLSRSLLPGVSCELYLPANSTIDADTLLCFAGFVDISERRGGGWQFKMPKFDPRVASIIQADNSVQDAKASAAASEGKRKPCANCSCGLRSTGVVTSACGSCHLGDPFRCGSCPYLGQPAFDPADPSRVKLVL